MLSSAVSIPLPTAAQLILRSVSEPRRPSLRPDDAEDSDDAGRLVSASSGGVLSDSLMSNDSDSGRGIPRLPSPVSTPPQPTLSPSSSNDAFSNQGSPAIASVPVASDNAPLLDLSAVQEAVARVTSGGSVASAASIPSALSSRSNSSSSDGDGSIDDVSRLARARSNSHKKLSVDVNITTMQKGARSQPHRGAKEW